MKKAILINSLLITALLSASPVFAQSADVSKVKTFLDNIIQIAVLLSGTVAAAFFVIGGFRYITSSGNPEALEGAKKTIMYSAIGLVVILAAYVIMNIVSQTATTAFGGAN